MLTGSCACGRVTYRIDGPLLGPVTHCHCWRCRKQSGASFGTTAGVLARDFRILTGQELLQAWESSPGTHRHFAGCCGSPIFKTDAATPDELGFRLGTLDTDPGVTAETHFRWDSRVPWLAGAIELPKEPGGPPFGTTD